MKLNKYNFWDLAYYKDIIDKSVEKGDTYYKIQIPIPNSDSESEWGFQNGRYTLIKKSGTNKEILTSKYIDSLKKILSKKELELLNTMKTNITMLFNINEAFLFNNILETPQIINKPVTNPYLCKRIENFKDLSPTSVSIIPMFHGTSDSSMYNINRTGFINKEDSPRRDNGFYGKGIYLTSDLNLARSYGKNILISLVVPGNIYFLNNQEVGNLTFLGKPVKTGYDSHYIQHNNSIYDELVIFNPERILPLFNITL